MSYAAVAVTGIIVGGATIWGLREIWSIGTAGQRPFTAVYPYSYAQPQQPQGSYGAFSAYPYDGTPGPFAGNVF